MIGAQIVYLLKKYGGPEIFADELKNIQFIFESLRVLGYPERKDENSQNTL